MDAIAFIGFGAGIIPLGLIILLVVAVSGGRNEPDPDGERPAALYYAAVMFVALFVTLFATFTVVASLINLTTDDGSVIYSSVGEGFTQFESEEPSPRILRQFSNPGEDDADYANALRAAIIAAVGAGLYVFHDRRRRKCVGGAVAERVKKTYLYVVSFVAVITALVAAVMALYAIVEMIAPGVTNAGTRGEAAAGFAQNAFLAAAAGVLFFVHLQTAEAPPVVETAPSVPPMPPPMPPSADLETAPVKAARKRAPAKKTTRKA